MNMSTKRDSALINDHKRQKMNNDDAASIKHETKFDKTNPWGGRNGETNMWENVVSWGKTKQQNKNRRNK